MKILVISAHPDDAEFACGGALLKLAQHHEVTLLVLTDGSAGSYGDASTRKQEQETAAKQAKVKLIWKGLPDTSLQHDRKHTLMLAQTIRNEQPDAILAPHWNQQGSILDPSAHPEHRITGLLAKDATRYARFKPEELKGQPHRTNHLLWYMTPKHLTPKIALDVSKEQENLLELWNCHKSQQELMKGKLQEHLLQRRKQDAHKQGAELVEYLDSDEPMSVSFLKELFP
jgi:N-acetylglucosamine malate deacetylase 1